MKRILLLVILLALAATASASAVYAAWDSPTDGKAYVFGTGEWMRTDEPKLQFADVVFLSAAFEYQEGVTHRLSISGGVFDDPNYASKGFIAEYTIQKSGGAVLNGNTATDRGVYTLRATVVHPFYEPLLLTATMTIE